MASHEKKIYRQSSLYTKFTPVADNTKKLHVHHDSWTQLMAHDRSDQSLISRSTTYRDIPWLGTFYEIFISRWKTEICMRMRARKCARTIIQVHVLLTISNCTRVGRPAKCFCHWPFACNYELQYSATLLYITLNNIQHTHFSIM